MTREGLTARMRARLGEALLVAVLVANFAFGAWLILTMHADTTRDLLLSGILVNAMMLLYLRRNFLVPDRRAVRSISETLAAHGETLPPRADAASVAAGVKTRLERYRVDAEEEKRRQSEGLERRIGEMTQAHQNLALHHKITKRMLQAREVDEVFDALLVGQVAEALEFMGLAGGAPPAGMKIDVGFIGSCTNGRISDLRDAARVARTGRVAPGVRTYVVPGSQAVARQAEAEGLPELFRAAGFDWREPGCSMCLAMNPDKLVGRELCASSSNRNFKGRQGSPTGRTLLMSPAMVAAAAIRGHVVDVREVL